MSPVEDEVVGALLAHGWVVAAETARPLGMLDALVGAATDGQRCGEAEIDSAAAIR